MYYQIENQPNLGNMFLFYGAIVQSVENTVEIICRKKQYMLQTNNICIIIDVFMPTM